MDDRRQIDVSKVPLSGCQIATFGRFSILLTPLGTYRLLCDGLEIADGLTNQDIDDSYHALMATKRWNNHHVIK